MPIPENHLNVKLSEDEVLSALSEKRDTKDSTFISHEDAWNAILAISHRP
jgi:hypothetical protein